MSKNLLGGLLELEQPGSKKQPAKPEPKPEPAPEYRAPYAALGQSVLWFPDSHVDESTAHHMALIVGVNGDTVDLALLFPGALSVQSKTGVRHADHPNKEAIDNCQVGCWLHTPETCNLVATIHGLSDLVMQTNQIANAALLGLQQLTQQLRGQGDEPKPTAKKKK